MDLKERLISLRDEGLDSPYPFDDTCGEAADELDRLRREMAEARELLERVADHGLVDDAPEIYAALWKFLRPDAAMSAP